MSNTRICPRCGDTLDPGKKSTAIYCSARCTDRASENRRRRRKARERRRLKCERCAADISHLHLKSRYCKKCKLSKAQTKKRRAVELKGGHCEDCGSAFGLEPGQLHYAVADFHHTDPTTKEATPSKLARVSWELFWAEVQKCALLCANCHRMRHI